MSDLDDDKAILSAGETAALTNQPRTTCPYNPTQPDQRRAAILWVRGYSYGLSVLRGRNA